MGSPGILRMSVSLQSKNIPSAIIIIKRGPPKSSDRKNFPEMNELERDLIRVKILSKNIEKQKS